MLLSLLRILHLYGGVAGVMMLGDDLISSTLGDGLKRKLKKYFYPKDVNMRLGSSFSEFRIKAADFGSMSRSSKHYSWRFRV